MATKNQYTDPRTLAADCGITDGTGTLYTVCECAIRDGLGTVADVRRIWADATEEWAAEREREARA